MPGPRDELYLIHITSKILSRDEEKHRVVGEAEDKKRDTRRGESSQDQGLAKGCHWSRA